MEFEGSILQVESAMETRRGGGSRSGNGGGSVRSRSGPSQIASYGAGNPGNPQRQADFPLR